MGAQVSASVNTTENYLNAITNAIVSAVSTCKITLTQDQIISFGDVEGNFRLSGISQTADNSLDLTCIQTDISNQEIQNKIEESLKQQAEAAVSGQNIGLQTSLTNNTLRAIKNVVTTIDISQVKNCIASSSQKQSIVVGDVSKDVYVDNIQQNLIAKSIAQCIQNNANTTSAVNDLKTTIDQSAKSTAVGFLNAQTLIIIAIIVFLLVICMSMVLYLLNSGDGAEGSDGSGGESLPDYASLIKLIKK